MPKTGTPHRRNWISAKAAASLALKAMSSPWLMQIRTAKSIYGATQTLA